MASSVFYRFKSQKDESRVTFDGTGISVFDLKREIILVNNMTKANDFDLNVYDATSNQGTHTAASIYWSWWILILFQSTRMTRKLSLVLHRSSLSEYLRPNQGKERPRIMLQEL